MELLNLMIEQGANVNIESDNGEYYRHLKSIGLNISNYVNITPMYIALTNRNMMDIVQFLRSKGASMTITANGIRVSILQVPGVLDEYKEYFMLEGIK